MAGAVPTAAVDVFSSVATVAPEQAGAIANAVIAAAPESAAQVVVALQTIQTAAGGANPPADDGGGDGIAGQKINERQTNPTS